MNELRLGIIGLSPGNGHPYSWSAIFNGYERQAMKACGFPVIPRYLDRQSWPDAQIEGARVTHVWTQDLAISRSIARASRIPHVAAALRDLTESVDAVLLARDDSQSHLDHAAPFLDAGIPIYIDKPIATNRVALHRLREQEQYEGQIFTCSALRYAQEMQLSDELHARIGRIKFVEALTPKAWNTYAVHVIEPVTAMLGSDKPVSLTEVTGSGDGPTTVRLNWGGAIDVRFTATGKPQGLMAINVLGEKDTVTMSNPCTFTAFRAALQDFIDGIRKGDVRTNWRDVDRIVEILEVGGRHGPHDRDYGRIRSHRGASHR